MTRLPTCCLLVLLAVACGGPDGSNGSNGSNGPGGGIRPPAAFRGRWIVDREGLRDAMAAEARQVEPDPAAAAAGCAEAWERLAPFLDDLAIRVAVDAVTITHDGAVRRIDDPEYDAGKRRIAFGLVDADGQRRSYVLLLEDGALLLGHPQVERYLPLRRQD